MVKKRPTSIPNDWIMLSHIIENTVCFNFNRKPNLWWRNSPWSLPLFLAMPLLRFLAEWWIELLRTKTLSFWCRFQPQLLSPTSLCRWHWSETPEWGYQCRVVRVSLRWCVAHSPLAGRISFSVDGIWYGSEGWSFFPSLRPSLSLLPPSLLCSYSFLWPLLFFFLSLFPSNKARHSSKWLYTFKKKTMLFCFRNFIIVSKQINKWYNFRQ